MPFESTDRKNSMGGNIGEIVTCVNNLIRSEITLAKAEVRETGNNLGKNIVKIATFSSIAVLGILPFFAFLVVGLGRLLNDNYWASSLIVSLICLGIGGFFAFSAYGALKKQDLSLPNTRETFHDELEMIDHNIEKISDFTKRRAA